MNGIEIEQTILGMMLLDPRRISTAVAMGLETSHFSLPLMGRSFEAIRDLWGAGKAIDVETINRVLGEVDNRQALMAIRSQAPPTQNFEPYVTALIDHRRSQEFRTSLAGTDRKLCERRAMDPVDPIIADHANAIAKFQGTSAAIKSSLIQESLDKALAAIEKRMVMTPGITTGFPSLDAKMHGWQPGNLYVLGARTSVGKTTLATNFAMNAVHAGYATAFVTVEMSNLEITEKIISQECRVELEKLKNGSLSDQDVDKIMAGINKIFQKQLTICEVLNPTIGHLENEILRLVRGCGVKFIVIDYLQLFRVGDGRYRPMREEALQVSSRLKQIAKANNVALLVLSQLNRQAPEFGKPALVHLAESDQVGRDADLVMFLHFEDVHANSFGLCVSKNRHGPLLEMSLSASLQHSHFGSKR